MRRNRAHCESGVLVMDETLARLVVRARRVLESDEISLECRRVIKRFIAMSTTRSLEFETLVTQLNRVEQELEDERSLGGYE